jgi:FAD/FMN-containing dehydrogenase
VKVASDVSIYEIEPKQVVYPKNCDDLIKVIRKLLLSKQSFTMRVGGTSIGGQSTARGVVYNYFLIFRTMRKP